MKKRLLRNRMKSRLQLLRPDQSSDLRERLHGNLKLILTSRPGTWATYRPMPLEANPLVGRIEGIEWVYPRIVGDRLVFFSAASFVKGAHGFEEPSPDSTIVAPELITGALVPGLAFDTVGGRLGRGRGFYDRTLQAFQGWTVGVAYSCQVLARHEEPLPMTPLDVRMQAVVTEQSVICCGGSFKWKS